MISEVDLVVLFLRGSFKLWLCVLIQIYTTEDKAEKVTLHLQQAGRQC